MNSYRSRSKRSNKFDENRQKAQRKVHREKKQSYQVKMKKHEQRTEARDRVQEI